MDLDVSRFPRELRYGNNPLTSINLASIVASLRNTFDDWVKARLVKPHPSFGFAAAHPNPLTRLTDWDDPYQFVWFVVGWGDEGDRYIANAVRKLRPALRHNRDTLDLRVNGMHLFQDIVRSADSTDGSIKWGDFPWGGATFVRVGNIILPCAVSCLKEVEDDAAAKTIGGHIGATMLRLDNPDEFS